MANIVINLVKYPTFPNISIFYNVLKSLAFVGFYDRMVNMNNLEQNLEVFGLDRKEARIYVFLLEHKDVPVTHIQKETLIPRATIYAVLDSLKKKGFVSDWLKNGVRHYSAESPKQMQNLLEQKSNALEEVMPELSRLFSIDSKNPTVKLYTGVDGVKNVYEIILERLKQEKIPKIYVYTDGKLLQRLPRFFREWRKRRTKTKAFTELIAPYSLENDPDHRTDPFRETRVIKGEMPFVGAFNICGSLVAFFSLKEENTYSVVIDSPIIAEMMTGIFKYVWNGLPSGKK